MSRNDRREKEEYARDYRDNSSRHHERSSNDRRRYYDRYESKPKVKEESKSSEIKAENPEVIIKELPNFEVSGILAEEQNQMNGVALTFSIPVDAVIPDISEFDWRLFEFDGDNNSNVVKLEKHSCFLFGHDARLSQDAAAVGSEVKYVLTPDTSASKQHALIQFRLNKKSVCTPYLMDLDSTNGTYLNGSRVDSARYVELRDQDVLKLGLASRLEYVVMDAR